MSGSNIKPLNKTELTNLISELESINIEKANESAIDEIVSRIYYGYKLNLRPIEPGILLFRAIKYLLKPLYFKDLIYPPIDKCRTNRANREGVQTFYCSTIKNAVFNEVLAVQGDRLVISNWISVKPIWSTHVGYSKHAFEELGSKYGNPVEKWDTEGRGELESEENLMIGDYIGKKFCKKITEDELYYYKLTNLIADKVFGKEKSDSTGVIFESIFYPTIPFNGDSDNFAIRRRLIDQGFLKLQEVTYIEILEASGNNFSYKILDIATEINDDGEILWLNIPHSYRVTSENDEIYFSDEHGHFQAFNSIGDQIPPED